MKALFLIVGGCWVFFLLGVVGSFFVVVCHNNVMLINKAGWVAMMYDVCMMYDV